MKDPDCIAFPQWALPCLGHRWPGYRKVRRQVCKRVQSLATSHPTKGTNFEEFVAKILRLSVPASLYYTVHLGEEL
jgi:hypothetical protein